MKVYIIRGAPGTGKTTEARKIIDENENAVHCSADNYFYEVAELNGTSYLEAFDRRLVGKAHQFCWHAFIHALVVMGEKTIIVDNTNIYKWEYENYVFLAEQLGYEVEIIITDMSESAEVYHERNTHGVPLDVIQRMLNEFEH